METNNTVLEATYNLKNEAIQFHNFVMDNFYTTYGKKGMYRMRQQNTGGVIDPTEYTITELYNVFHSNFQSWFTPAVNPIEGAIVFTYFNGLFNVCEYMDGAFIETHRCLEINVSHWKYAEEPKTTTK